MVGCGILICKSQSERKVDGITFHPFPFDPEIKIKWLVATGQQNWQPTKYSKICSIHFDDDAFIYKTKKHHHHKQGKRPKTKLSSHKNSFTRSAKYSTEAVWISKSNRLCVLRKLSVQSGNKENETNKQTHFGFETVAEEEKWKKVHEVFETVANKYDVMNDAMSLGIHRIWKDIFMHRLAPTHGTKLLDVAGGTGDISFRYINYLKNLGSSVDSQSAVTVSDINQAMLDVGKLRALRQGMTKESTGVDLDWLCADAEKLPIPDESYTAYTIAFGIRNCTHVDKVLEEAYRVLTPGGRFMCLEFSQLPNEPMQWLYDQYSFQVIPVLGQLIAGQWKPYQYLVESIRQFPNQEKFKSMIEDAGFRQVTYENLTFGVCAIHSGFKI